jgi:hypothetical protein
MASPELLKTAAIYIIGRRLYEEEEEEEEEVNKNTLG